MNLNTLIIEHVARDHEDGWLLRAYLFLVKSDIHPDKAVEALSSFVDEVIARKHAKRPKNTRL